MQRSVLLVALAIAFGAMTVALAVAGLLFNLAILAAGIPFGVATYVLWAHGTGQLATRAYHRVQQRAATNGGRPDAGRIGHGRGRRARSRRAAHAREESRRSAGRRAGGQEAGPSVDGPTPREARAILGVDADADSEAIRAAYRERVRTVHPDVDGGDTDAFKRVTAAYETLREDGA